MQSLWLPAIQAQLELNQNNPALALKTLQIALPPSEFGLIAFAANASARKRLGSRSPLRLKSLLRGVSDQG